MTRKARRGGPRPEFFKNESAREPRAPTGVGHSLLAGPDGTVRAEAGAGSQLLVVDVDDDEVTGIRKVIPVLANGRVTEASAGEVPR